MATALLGYTGYVGSTLLSQRTFDDVYNSKNITEIQGKQYEVLVCAAAPAVKWKANQNPEEDLRNLESLINNLKKVDVEKFILISTVDVYKNPQKVDEDTRIFPEEVTPYGRHRYYLEEFVIKNFKNHTIIRLPGLFGNGLKKNFIFDLIHTNCLHLTHSKSEFQFYNMNSLWSDIEIAVKHNLSLVNFAVEPVKAAEIAQAALNYDFNNETDNAPVFYNMLSKHSELFQKNKTGNYFKNKSEILSEISSFIVKERSLY
ncbi:NAD-dependent epimerase/dehydratase family protein [Paenibacillus sp. FSL H7-0350]|uniref:NAD-dependent epimerase/dehydratase family protein n=1 Tax=Paenibacillus sp. FSL H7-0350 TaxID=2975345 RepID=UPI0031594FDB